MTAFYRPDFLYHNGLCSSGVGLLVADNGEVLDIAEAPPASPCDIVDLPRKVLLPGFVNAHSHSFHRLVRGKAESRECAGRDFWSWREMMYRVAAYLNPEDIYDVARIAFLEMLLAGTTTVGEFHYLHKAPDGNTFADPNLMSKRIIDAAKSVGIRIVLLRVAYLRSGYDVPMRPGQRRFLESTDEFLSNIASLLRDVPRSTEVSLGVAPHSIRAVPLDDLAEITAWARNRNLPIHMHVAEQQAEIDACEHEYGSTPLTLLDQQRLLGPDFTAVHAIHISQDEMARLAAADATICSCPTAERNLGDGVIAADEAAMRGIRIALGSDSQAQIDPLEDARGLDYHLRLAHKQRVILDQIGDQGLSNRLFECATANGARSLMVAGGELAKGLPADFFTVNLSDPSVAGSSADDLLAMIVFSLNRSAICDVAVGGKLIIRDHSHSAKQEIISRYNEVYGKVWLRKNHMAE